MKSFFSLCFCLILGSSNLLAGTMASPDGSVVAHLSVTANGSLEYQVDFKGTTVVEPSRLGITVAGVDLGHGVKIDEPVVTRHDSTYVTRGNHTEARDHHHAWSFPVNHPASGQSYHLEFRLYDDGAAYRYVVPGTGPQLVNGESSSWKLMAGSKVWYFERLTPGWKLKSYAGEWLSTEIENLETATPASVGPIQGPPLVLELPNDLGYAAVTKAALYNYSGMRLEAVGDRTVIANFTEGADGFEVNGTITTPWRATLLADDLNELVNSDFINNLNPAPDPELFADTSYIKPGRSAWSWETISLGTPADQKRFIDLAAEADFEYSIIDDGWKDWPDPWGTIKALCDHGREKGVGVFVWVHSRDIRNPADNYRQMRDYFAQVAATGSVGLKIDFMNGETKELVDFEIAALRIAAENRLLINFHGCHASTGEERTYPNELTREGIRGLEVNKMKEGPLPASHNAALPFTRLVVGHGDYTPVLYSNPGPTTWAHQLATTVAFNSPLQVYCDDPDWMMNSPILKDAFTVTRAMPTVWDETIILPGSKIGDLTVMARRSGEEWFVGILNGGAAREYDLDLSFLATGTFEATLVRDDPDADRVNLVGWNQKADLHEFPTALPFKVEQVTVRTSGHLQVSLAEGGGFVAHVRRTAGKPQITERPRPPEWQNLVRGARFQDLFEPMPDLNSMTADTWGEPGVIPREFNNGIESPDWSYWGGNAIKDADGKYHLLICRWAEDDPKGHFAYHDSIVVRAEADNLYGPYIAQEEIGPGHNPTWFTTADGTYVLYTTLGRYTAGSIYGPWTASEFVYDNRDRVISAQRNFLHNNSFQMREDGSFMMINRHGMIWFSQDGLSPYQRITEGRIYPPVEGKYEDPVLWRDHVQYHVIVNDWFGRLAWYLRSKDGVDWTVDAGEAYTHSFTKRADGSSENWFKYERIRMVQDEHGRAIAANFAVIDDDKHSDLPSDNHSSKNIFIPLTVSRMLAVLNEAPITPRTTDIQVKLSAEPGFDPHQDVDLESLRFGAADEVNFGRGSSLKGTKKSGRDLILIFDGEGNGFGPDHFAGKLLGQTASGEILFGWSRLPGVDYNPPILSARAPEFGADGATVVVENFGQVASSTSKITLLINDRVAATGTIPALPPFAQTSLSLPSNDTWPHTGEHAVTVRIDSTGFKPVTFTSDIQLPNP